MSVRWLQFGGAHNDVYVEVTPRSGTTFSVACLSFGMNFGVNELPHAECQLAVGRSSLKTGQISSTMALTDTELLSGAGARVLCRVVTPTGAVTQVLFSGYILGTGYEKSAGNVSIAVTIHHWLSTLCDGSIFSKVSHPADPWDTMFPAVLNPRTMTGAKDKSTLLSSMLPMSAPLSGEGLTRDVWGNFLRPVLLNMAAFNIPEDGCGVQPKQNDPRRLVTALSRIEGPALTGLKDSLGADVGVFRRFFGYNTPATGLGYQVGGPLPLVQSDTLIADGIRKGVTGQDALQLKNASMWDAMISWLLPSIGLMLCPMRDRAVVMPNYAGLSPTYRVVLNPSDVVAVTAQTMINKPIRGVYVLGRPTSLTGLSPREGCPVGVYMPDPDGYGVIRYMPAPPWITNGAVSLTGVYRFAPAEKSKITTAFTESVASKTQVTGRLTSVAEMLDRYAKMLYHQYVSGGCELVVTLPFTLGIGPGTYVELRTATGPDEPLTAFCGMATRVTVTLSGDKSHASTVVRLGNVQPAKQAAKTPQKHPLYDNHIRSRTSL